MGVKSLWALLRTIARPVQLEELEGKKLAVDASIWLNQFVKVSDLYQNKRLAPHIVGFFKRICKLLHYRIKPVIVFDGRPPDLKIKTISKRRQLRSDAEFKQQLLARRIAMLRAKMFAMSKQKRTSPKASQSIKQFSEYHLPEITNFKVSESDPRISNNSIDLYEVLKADYEKFEKMDMNSDAFNQLPSEVKYQILVFLKWKSRHNSGNKVAQMSKVEKPLDFSQFQIKHLVRRNELTQQVLNFDPSHHDQVANQEVTKVQRIVSEKQTEFVLTKRCKDFRREVGDSDSESKAEFSSDTEEEEFQDVPIKIPDVQEKNINIFEFKNEVKFGQSTVPENISETPILPDEDDEEFVHNWILLAPTSFRVKFPNFAVGFRNLAFDCGNKELEAIIQNVKNCINDECSFFESSYTIDFIRNLLEQRQTSSSSDFVNFNPQHFDKQDTKQRNDLSFQIKNIPEDYFSKTSNSQTTLGLSDQEFNSSNDEQEDFPYDILSEFSSLSSDRNDTAFESNSNENLSLTNTAKSNDPCSNQLVENNGEKIDEDFSFEDRSNIAENSEVTQAGAFQENVNFNTKSLPSEKLRTNNANPSKSENETSYIPINDNEFQETVAETEELIKKVRTLERNAASVTEMMIGEVKDLLRLCGIPYVESPSEAEAQCAFLEKNGLVDGIITDDNDVFLFGGSKVYRHFFKASKHIELYVTADVERDLGLDRSKLVIMATLLGCDYCDGIPGIGIVTCYEIINEWCIENGFEGLKDFRDWFREKYPLKTGGLETKLNRFESLVLLTDSLSNEQVRKEFENPVVDSSLESFKWGLPDLDGLRCFLGKEAGWEIEKVDELVLPLLQRLQKGSKLKQTTLNSFFHKFANSSVESNRNKASQKVFKIVQSWKRKVIVPEEDFLNCEVLKSERKTQKAKQKRKKQRT